MATDTQDRPDISERYECAANTSRLLLEEHRTGAGDVLTSAGMAQQFPAGTPPPPYSQLRTGMALLRLHSEWSAAAKPRRMSILSVEMIVRRIQADDRAAEATAKRNGVRFVHPGSAVARGRLEADAWFASELRLLAQSLKSREAVWTQLAPWAALKGHDQAVVAEALHHWLSPVCKGCDGLKLLKAANSPALSGSRCDKCNGTGNSPQPYGAAKVLEYLELSVQRARQSIKRRLRSD